MTRQESPVYQSYFCRQLGRFRQRPVRQFKRKAVPPMSTKMPMPSWNRKRLVLALASLKSGA